MKTVNKTRLAQRVAENNYGVTHLVATNALDAIIEEIQVAVEAGEKVGLADFGTFEPRERNARIVRNPRTGEEIPKEATSVPAFKAADTFKKRVADADAAKRAA